jgi:molybdopterin converting factor small subunit
MILHLGEPEPRKLPNCTLDQHILGPYDGFPATAWYSNTPMRVTVRLFASHREATGVQSMSLDLPEGTRALGALAVLHERYPGLRSAASAVAFAVNRLVVEPNLELHDGDELALLPPMAGG